MFAVLTNQQLWEEKPAIGRPITSINNDFCSCRPQQPAGGVPALLSPHGPGQGVRRRRRSEWNGQSLDGAIDLQHTSTANTLISHTLAAARFSAAGETTAGADEVRDPDRRVVLLSIRWLPDSRSFWGRESPPAVPRRDSEQVSLVKDGQALA